MNVICLKCFVVRTLLIGLRKLILSWMCVVLTFRVWTILEMVESVLSNLSRSYKKSVPEGRHIPGIVFMRGPSVAILLVLNCNGMKYTIVTRQPRTPIADASFTEIPAGVFDGEQFAGVAAKELREEVGLSIESSQLVDMTAAVYGSKYPGIYPSPGGCDEYIKLFLYEKDVTKEELDSYMGKATGLMEEGEYICLKVIPLDSLVKETSDAKALCAYSLYNYLSSK